MSTIDWPAIRAKYESGISQRTLAKEYGISQAAISKRAAKERWVISPVFEVINDNPSDNQTLDTSAPAIAEQARYIIAKAIQKMKQEGLTSNNPILEYEEHKRLKLLMDSLSQAHKIELASPSEQPTASGIDADLLPWLDLDQLNKISELHAEIDAILELARQKKLEQEQGIKTIRKQA